MIRQLKRFNAMRQRLPGDMCLAFAGYGQVPGPGRYTFPAPEPATVFPRRPDASVISETIPLFYIGQNQNGFWVAREAEGRSGGLFLRKRSALRFARKRCEPAGCAMMFLGEPFELDVVNRGSRIVVVVGAALNFAERRAPALLALIGSMAAEWRKLVRQITRAFVAERRHRELEGEPFRGSSKNNDELPGP